MGKMIGDANISCVFSSSPDIFTHAANIDNNSLTVTYINNI